MVVVVGEPGEELMEACFPELEFTAARHVAIIATQSLINETELLSVGGEDVGELGVAVGGGFGEVGDEGVEGTLPLAEAVEDE